ncbi:hypothetical protein KORDIASMS9_04498 [Kordia sp. SMS9]|uniref:hypothetical protein n=1 Tax=Kordia sp. SMS9 TaxID=2282170 RepID=UPI000E0D1AE3|nr:hypothetical protein [Kordia sp. SMS9]AXG72230.1 hypothetical protein KORDIASMS9_04498 [Kordia sp. SMS9]
MALPKKSFLLITFLISFALAFFVAYSLMGDPDISNVKAEYSGSTEEFLSTIKENHKDWTDAKKVVLLTGVITSKDKKGVLLDDSVYFRFAEGTSMDEFKEGQKVQVKGSVMNYDVALEELQLENAVLVKK